MIHLAKREKLLVVALAIFVAAWGLVAFTVKPATARVKTLARVIPEKQDELTQLRSKSQEYTILRNSFDDLRARAASQETGFELLPFLESLIQECGLAKNVAAMKQHILPLDSDYSETMVEIRLENLTLRQLVNFLGKVDSSDVFARTKTLHITRNPISASLLNSVIEVHSIRLTESQSS